MDPERQPLLRHQNEARRRSLRPLTYEEVVQVRQEVVWRRTRFFLILMFWALMAMFLSIITCIVVTAPSCRTVSLEQMPSVPPVHMSFGPLISRMNEQVYAL